MQVKIKSISLQFFKGVKSATYQFDGKNVSVIGQNGAGKTTIFTAYMWLMADKDSDLKNNPNIRPLDAEECTPRVEAVFDIDGKEVVVEKFQKMKKKEYEKNGQKVTEISTENSYKVNHSPMGLTQFKKKMATYGFDMEKFMQLSHPDVFTNQMAAKKDLEKMRDTLFEMTESYTDLQIAEMMGNVPEVAKLLTANSKDEIRATQNDALRDIRENYGKDGEILRAKIEGMEQSKTDIDVAELESRKNALNKQIAKNKAKQEDVSKEFEEQQRASDGVIELRMELNGLQQKANESLDNKRREIRRELDDLDFQMKEVKHQIRLNKQDIQSAEDSIKRNTTQIQICRQKWSALDSQVKAENERVFDENSLVCSYCGQEYPEDRKEQLRAEFDSHKAEEIKRLESGRAAVAERGNGLKAAIDKDKAEIEQLKATLKENEDEEINLLEAIKGLEKSLEEVPQSVEISDRPEVQEIKRKIAEKEADMNKGHSTSQIRGWLKAEAEELQKQMDKVKEQFALVKKNMQIDDNIADLCKKQSEFEQNRANAEKILDQLDLVSKRKNELLTDQVNSHFKLVKFRLFDYLKNGNVVDDCEPMIDGKSLKDHSNGALRVLAKLDIVDGLQRFYGQHYPVFAEDFSLVTENTECRINMDCQLIKLVAEKGVKELKIETEG